MKHCRNTYHIPKIAHERALKSCRSYTAYATAVLHDLFKPSVTMLCTCTGYSKGRAADGNDRASLPNEAIAVFFGTSYMNSYISRMINSQSFATSNWITDHCCSVGSVTYEVKESDESMKQRLQRSINVYLNAHRKKKDLVPTVAQSERKAAATSMYLISESD
jgi:hypothetical protein